MGTFGLRVRDVGWLFDHHICNVLGTVANGKGSSRVFDTRQLFQHAYVCGQLVGARVRGFGILQAWVEPDFFRAGFRPVFCRVQYDRSRWRGGRVECLRYSGPQMQGVYEGSPNAKCLRVVPKCKMSTRTLWTFSIDRWIRTLSFVCGFPSCLCARIT
jgi:hypothetical protein